MQYGVYVAGLGPYAFRTVRPVGQVTFRPKFREKNGILPPAFVARSVTGRERRSLVQEKQFRIAIWAHDFTPAPFEGETAGNPRLTHPLARPESLVEAMDHAAPVSHERASRAGRDDLAVRCDTVGERHRSVSGFLTSRVYESLPRADCSFSSSRQGRLRGESIPQVTSGI